MAEPNTLKMLQIESQLLLNIGQTFRDDGAEIFFIPFAFRRKTGDPVNQYELIPLPQADEIWKELMLLQS